MRLGAIHRPPPAGLHQLARLSAMEGTPPTHADWLCACPADGNALGNDLLGNCVEAAMLQTIAIRRAVVRGDAWRPSTLDAVALYSLLTGYDPATERPDAGTDTITAMNWWAVRGVQAGSDTDVSLWAPSYPHYAPHLAMAIAYLGPVQATFALPRAAEGLPDWDVAPGTGEEWAAASWGYHRVVVGAFDGLLRRARSWGRDLTIHPEWWAAYCVGVDVPLSREWCDTVGRSPAGLDWQGLAATLDRIAA
jgi:hypothetical protein